MTDTTDPRLPDEVVDELLSAQLDGELDAAARDHDMTTDEALAMLARTPGIEARRAALARAQSVSTADTVTLDAVTRERLVRAANPRDRTAARRREWRALTAVAAAAAVAGVTVLAARSLGSGHSSSKSSAGTSAAALAPAPVIGNTDFGAIDSDTALRAITRGTDKSALSGSATTTAPGARSTSSATPPSTVTADRTGGGNATEHHASGAQCGATLASSGPSDTDPGSIVILGFGTHAGKPVAVASGRAGPNTVGWAFDPATCVVVLVVDFTTDH